MPRYEMLNRIGHELSSKKRRLIREKEKEEEEELQAMSFHPRTRHHLDDTHLMKASDIDVIDRNMKWVQRKEEKLQRLK